MENRGNIKKLILLFIIIVYVITAIGYFIWFYLGSVFNSDYFQIAAAIPILSIPIASLVIYIKSKKEVKVPFGNCSIRDALLGIIIPIIYFGIPYIIYCIYKGGIIGTTISKQQLVIVIIQYVAIGICEEMGWRGILLPLMKKAYNFNKAIILNGVVWAVWHYPMIFGGLILNHFNLLQGIILFTVELILLTAIMAILQLNLQPISIWPMVLLHMSHGIVVELIINSNANNVIIGEAGYLTLAVMVVCIIFMVYRSKSKYLLSNKE